MRPTLGYADFGIPPLCSFLDLRKQGITLADIQRWFNASQEIIYLKQQEYKKQSS